MMSVILLNTQKHFRETDEKLLKIHPKYFLDFYLGVKWLQYIRISVNLWLESEEITAVFVSSCLL